MSKFSYNPSNNTVRVFREDGGSFAVTAKDDKILWTGLGARGMAEGLRAFGDLYDAVKLTKQEFNFMAGKFKIVTNKRVKRPV